MGLIAWVKNLFKPLIKSLWGMLKKIFSGGTEIVLAQLRSLAIDAVLMVASDPSILKDTDKQKKAFEILKTKAIEKAIPVRDSLINLAIELAVAYLKQIGRLG